MVSDKISAAQQLLSNLEHFPMFEVGSCWELLQNVTVG